MDPIFMDPVSLKLATSRKTSLKVLKLGYAEILSFWQKARPNIGKNGVQGMLSKLKTLAGVLVCKVLHCF